MMATMSDKLENELRRSFKNGDEFVTVIEDAGADGSVNVATVTTSGNIVSGGNVTATEIIVTGQVVLLTDEVANFNVPFSSTPPGNQTLTNDATITLPSGINKVVDSAGAVTGIILAAGSEDGQIVNIINASANTVTFATGATSNVADGTSAVIAANRAISLIWDFGSSRWYRTG